MVDWETETIREHLTNPETRREAEEALALGGLRPKVAAELRALLDGDETMYRIIHQHENFLTWYARPNQTESQAETLNILRLRLKKLWAAM